jgi:hypothetical protein
MDLLSEFRSARAELEALSLRRRPPPETQVRLGRTLAESFAQMSQPERGLTSSEVSASAAGSKLLSLSGYIAETAINSRESTLLRVAVTLHVIEGFQKDYRENIRYLVLIAHAARKLDVDLSPIILSVETFASTLAKSRLAEFSPRESSLNSLASIGVKEDIASGEFRFVPA